MKSIKINGNVYLNIVYENTNINDSITKNYANGFKEKNIYDKYGRIVEKYRVESGSISDVYYSYDAAEGAAGKLRTIYAGSRYIEFWYNEYNQVKTIRHTANLREILRCDISYNEKQLVANETYFDQRENLILSSISTAQILIIIPKWKKL